MVCRNCYRQVHNITLNRQEQLEKFRKITPKSRNNFSKLMSNGGQSTRKKLVSVIQRLIFHQMFYHSPTSLASNLRSIVPLLNRSSTNITITASTIPSTTLFTLSHISLRNIKLRMRTFRYKVIMHLPSTKISTHSLYVKSLQTNST